MKLKEGTGGKSVSNSKKLFAIMAVATCAMALLAVGAVLSEGGYSDVRAHFDQDGFLFSVTSYSNHYVEVVGYEGNSKEPVIPTHVVYEGETYSVDSIGIRAFFNNGSITTVTMPDELRFIKDSAFKGCSELTRIILPDSIESLDDEAFSSCKKLSTVILGVNLKAIGAWTFHRAAVDVLVIPESVTFIGGGAFCSCTMLRDLTLPTSVNPIVDRNYPAFEGCSGINKITITQGDFNAGPGEAYRLTPWYLSKDSLTRIILAEGVTSIPENMFRGCGNERLVFEMPVSGLLSIEDNAFRSCSFLNDNVVPQTVTTIGNNAFNGCKSLVDLRLVDTVTVGENAFRGCIELKTLSMSDNLSSIGKRAFDGCISLSTIAFGKGLEFLGENAFAGITFFNEGGTMISATVINLCGWTFEGSANDMRRVSA